MITIQESVEVSFVVKSTADVMRKLVEIRKISGLTQREVADRMHVMPNAVCQIEARATRDGRDLQLASLLRYCDAIGVRLTIDIVPGGDRS